MSYEKITVFGGGNAAFAVAAALGLRGKQITLCDFPEFASAIEPIRQAGEIDLIRDEGDDTGPLEGRTRIHRVTTDLAAAIRGAELVVVCAQAYAHGRLARDAAPHFQDGQHVLLLPGSCFGAWEFRRTLQQAGCTAELVVAESNTLVFATRKTNVPNQARIKVWATEVFVAALPACDTDKILAPFAELFPQCVAANDTLETCLLNLNPYVHSAPAVLSISAVEKAQAEGRDFFHYMDGITPSTARVAVELDQERIRLCKALGYRDWSVSKIFNRAGYTTQVTDDWMADMQSKNVLRTAKGPFNIQYRYYTEDTGVGLAVVHSIGRRLNIAMPTHFALVHLTGIMAQRDFLRLCTRDVATLGIPGQTPQALRAAFVESQLLTAHEVVQKH